MTRAMKTNTPEMASKRINKFAYCVALFVMGCWCWNLLSSTTTSSQMMRKQALVVVSGDGGASSSSMTALTDSDKSTAKDLCYWSDVWWITHIKGTSLRLDTDNGMLIFPPNITRVWIDVGVHGQSDFLPNLKEQPDLFLLGFEPAINLYKPCDQERCVVFWAACTPTAQMVELNIQGAGGLCNSLLKPNSNTSAKIYRGCVEQEKDAVTGQLLKYKVPGMPLSYGLARIPTNIQVEYIKIDAQGFDLEVMKGVLLPLPHAMKSVQQQQQQHQVTLPQVVSLEAIDVQDRSALLYHGQPTLDDVVTFMKSRGWVSVFNSTNNGGTIHEVNAYFAVNETFISKVDSLPKK